MRIKDFKNSLLKIFYSISHNFSTFHIFSFFSLSFLFFFEASFLLYSTKAKAFDTFFDTKAEIPEPLVFDLVGRINSHKGEFEINSLFLNNPHQPSLSNFYVAPEIEYAFADGQALELEFPSEKGQIIAYKIGYQKQLPSFRDYTLSGLQIVYEQTPKSYHHELSILYLFASHFTEEFSQLMMIGIKNSSTFSHHSLSSQPTDSYLSLDQNEEHRSSSFYSLLLNLNFFLNLSKIFDLGLEFNGEWGPYDQTYLLMPQMHFLFYQDIKIQTGLGSHLTYTKGRSSPQQEPLFAFRLIKEFN
jgi:hypothetical protein